MTLETQNENLINQFNTDRIEFNLGGPDPLLQSFPKLIGIDHYSFRGLHNLIK